MSSRCPPCSDGPELQDSVGNRLLIFQLDTATWPRAPICSQLTEKPCELIDGTGETAWST